MGHRSCDLRVARNEADVETPGTAGVRAGCEGPGASLVELARLVCAIGRRRSGEEVAEIDVRFKINDDV